MCYWHRVLLAPSCVQRVRERVATVYSSFIGCMGGEYRQLVFSEFELHNVISEHSALTDGYTIWDDSSN